MSKRYLVLLTWVTAGFSSPLLAQKVGSEFQVNTYTTGDQLRGSVASDKTGNFIVVWSSDGQDGSETGIFGQRYDSSGSPLEGEFQVNTYTTGFQGDPRVASDANGNFVVVWNDGTFSQDGEDGSDGGIFGQRYDSGGTPLGGEFQVNTYTMGDQEAPSVASDANGNFVVIWNDGHSFQDGEDGSEAGIFGQRYDSGGTPLGGEFQVNTHTAYSQFGPSVASDANGNFVVVWTSVHQDGYSSGVFGQRYDSGGTPLGGEFQVNTYTPSLQNDPHVASDASGNFVVIWESYGQVGKFNAIFGQRYDSSGNPRGGEFQVNTLLTDAVISYSSRGIASDVRGNFVVVWDVFDRSAANHPGIHGQRYNSDGNPLGKEFLVNTYRPDGQYSASVSSDANGNFVVVWTSESQDGDNRGVFGQRFARGCRSTASNPTFLCSESLP